MNVEEWVGRPDDEAPMMRYLPHFIGGKGMIHKNLILVLSGAVAMTMVACTDGSNVERSTARSLENAGSVYKKYEPKVIGPGESTNPNARPTPYPENR